MYNKHTPQCNNFLFYRVDKEGEHGTIHTRAIERPAYGVWAAASNALTLPGGNGIRITHYTLQAKLCAKWGAVPFGYPPP